MKCFILIWSFPLFILGSAELQVSTSSAANSVSVFQYRVPSGYDSSRPGTWRVLVLFGGRNTDGKAEASGRLGWGEWADENGIFLLCPGFRNDNYWEPQKWSGKALISALHQLSRKYRICTDHILYYGYSAGSQASNLFAAWRPRICRAWVSHACGYFHRPHAGLAGLPGLVTCGDVDRERYVISRRFVRAAQRAGERIILRSFPHRNHEIPPESLVLARAFLKFYHVFYMSDLEALPQNGKKEVRKAVRQVPTLYIGDDLDGTYYPVGSKRIRGILMEDRVPLPSKAVADAWGEAEGESAP